MGRYVGPVGATPTAGLRKSAHRSPSDRGAPRVLIWARLGGGSIRSLSLVAAPASLLDRDFVLELLMVELPCLRLRSGLVRTDRRIRNLCPALLRSWSTHLYNHGRRVMAIFVARRGGHPCPVSEVSHLRSFPRAAATSHQFTRWSVSPCTFAGCRTVSRWWHPVMFNCRWLAPGPVRSLGDVTEAASGPYRHV